MTFKDFENKIKPYKHIIFDFDGVLYKDNGKFMRMVRGLTLNVEAIESRYNQGLAFGDIFGNFANLEQHFKDEYLKYFTEDNLKEQKRIIRPFLKLIDKPMTIISNNNKEMIKEYLRNIKCYDLIDYIYDGDYKKPDIRLMDNYCLFTFTTLTIKECIYIGDKSIDKEFADNCGMTYLKLTYDEIAEWQDTPWGFVCGEKEKHSAFLESKIKTKD